MDEKSLTSENGEDENHEDLHVWRGTCKETQ